MDEPAWVALADTAGSRQIHHRVRYAVYCQKRAYEDAQRFPDGEERDVYDETAVHFVAYDGQDWTGAVRLIPPSAGGLPMSGLAKLSPHVAGLVAQQRVAEISRMCSTGPDVFEALIRACFAYAYQHGYGYVAWLTTAPLARLLRRAGVSGSAAGDGCDHRGRRRPFIGNTAELYRAIPAGPHYTAFSALGWTPE